MKTKEPPLPAAPQTAPRTFADQNLSLIIEAWPTLAADIQAAIAAIANANRSP
jgi:hypothetical protein